MILAVKIPCLICKNIIKNSSTTSGFICKAFEDGIPLENLLSEDPRHSKPLKSQKNDVVFALDEEKSKLVNYTIEDVKI